MSAPEITDGEAAFWQAVGGVLDRRDIRRLHVSAASSDTVDATVYLGTADPVEEVLEALVDAYGARVALYGPEIDSPEQAVTLLGRKMVAVRYYDPGGVENGDDDDLDVEPVEDEPPVMSPDDTEAAYQEMRRRVVVDTPMDQPHGKWSIWAHVREVAADIERETGQRYVLRDMDEFGALYAVMDDHKQNWIDRAGEIARHLVSEDPTLLTANRATRIEAIRGFMRSEDLHCASNVTAGTVATEFNRLAKCGELDDYRLL